MERPAFPISLEQLLPPEVVRCMSAVEKGAALNLLAHAWQSDPPCTLADDADDLAAMAGLSGEEWSRAVRRLARCWSVREDPGPTPRVVFTQALKVWEDLRRRANRIAEGGRLGAAKRWGGHGPPNSRPNGDGNAPLNASPIGRPWPGHGGAIPPSDSPSGSATAPPSEARLNKRLRAPKGARGARGAEARDFASRLSGAEARMPSVRTMLGRAKWDWPEKPHQRAYPDYACDEAAANKTLEKWYVAFALWRVERLRPDNPVGYLNKAFGPKRWDVSEGDLATFLDDIESDQDRAERTES